MENKYNKTRSLVEAGLLSALIVIIMLLNVYVPVFSAVGTFLLPIPVTLLYIRHSYKVTILAVVVSTILIATLYNPLSALSSAISYGLTGITLGYCVRKDVKVSTTILSLAAVSIVSMTVNGMIIIFFLERTTVLGMMKEYIDLMKESTNMTKSMYDQLGVNTQQFDAISNLWDVFTPEYIATLIPAMLVLAGFLSAFLNYSITRALLKKMRYNIRELAPFNKFYIDNRIGALIIIFICLGLILSTRKYAISGYIINSSFIVLQFALLLDGAAVAVFYLKNRFNIQGKLLVVILFFIIISRLSIALVYLGIIDMIFDFRKLDPNRLFKRRNS